MSAGEVIHTSSTGGQKAGNNTRVSLIPAVELLEVAELYGKGASKYDDHNWTKGYAWSLSYDALQRHLGAFWSGEEYDTGEGGTGLQHLACAAFHVFTLMYYAKHHRALDDRHIPPAQPVGTFESGLLGAPTTVPALVRACRDSVWQSQRHTRRIYKFNGLQWVMKDPGSHWSLSSYGSGDVDESEGPFFIYQGDEA